MAERATGSVEPEPPLKKHKTALPVNAPSSSSPSQKKENSGEATVPMAPLVSSTVSHMGMKKYQQDMCITIREEEVTTLAPALNDTRSVESINGFDPYVHLNGRTFGTPTPRWHVGVQRVCLNFAEESNLPMATAPNDA